MVGVLVDTSIVVKWYHEAGEPEVLQARAIVAAHERGDLAAMILDLTVYEYGNVLLRSLRKPVDEVVGRVEDLIQLCGPPVALEPAWRREAAELGAAHGLTYYDAAYAAAARGLQAPLVTADRKLLASGLAESATEFCQRMRFPVL